MTIKILFYVLLALILIFVISSFVISFCSWNGGEGPSAEDYNWKRENCNSNKLYEHSYTTQRSISTEWIKEQRNKMNRNFAPGLTLREFILERDNYTCQCCGNSIKKESNLLLEVDHIKPVSKGGASIPGNLQTLCWKCNRSKSNKI